MAVCGICLIHTRYTSLPDVITRPYESLRVNIVPLCGYGATCVWNLRAFIIPLTPGSPHPPPPSRLESLGTRLDKLELKNQNCFYKLIENIIIKKCHGAKQNAKKNVPLVKQNVMKLDVFIKTKN